MAHQAQDRRGEQHGAGHPFAARRRATGAAVAVVLALTGCAHTGHGLATYDAAEEDAASGSSGEGPDQFDGTLVVAADCVRVEAADGGQVLPVFPSTGVDFDHDSLVLTFGGTGYRDGDPVTLAGSVVTDQSGIAVPSGCDAPTMWRVTAD